jgi:hypothetical protein
MGLMVHSLEGIPETHHRDYFIYLLDFGWREPLGEALKMNFGKMATLASEKKNAVVIMRTDDGIHFSDEVLSWHSINGDEAEKNELLPAILITNRHPAEFKRRAKSAGADTGVEPHLKMILFPLRKYCSTTSDVVDLVQKIFIRIKQGKDLDDFGIVKQKNKGEQGAAASSLIIEPTPSGTTIAFNTITTYFSDKSK